METNNFGTDTNAIDSKLDQATSGVHQTIDRVTNAARPAVDRVASGAHQAVDSMAEAASKAADSLGIKTAQLKEAQERLMESCSAYVQENPLASLGIAVAAGFLLSRLVSSR